MAESKITLALKVKRVWFPAPRMLITIRNDSYLNSLFVGLVTPILCLPRMVWAMCLLPLIKGLVVIIGFTLRSFITGLLGYAAGIELVVDDTANTKKPV